MKVSKQIIISTQTGVIDSAFGENETLKMMSKAGFTAMDYSITQKAILWNEAPFNDVTSNEFKEYFINKRNAASSYRIKIAQTHAPYRRPFQWDAKGYEEVLEQTIRAIYATSYLTAPYIVAHPVIHPDFNNGQNSEKAAQANVRYFSKFVPYLKELGVIMCIENLYLGQQDDPKTSNVCSDADSLLNVIDTLNDSYGNLFAACVDTGHAIISGNDPALMIKKLGNRVKTLHIHDSQGVFDDHQTPGNGIIDWVSVMKALKEINYQGTFNFETDNMFYDYCKPIYNKEVMEQTVGLLYSIGKSLLAIN